MNKNKNFKESDKMSQDDDFAEENQQVEGQEGEKDAADDELTVESLLEENHKLKENYLRAYAEAENVKRRCQQEMEKSVKFAVADFAKSLLTVADNLQRAIDACNDKDDDEDKSAFLKGIELTQNELMKVFDKFNIHKMEIMGTVFDPNFHQVVQEVEDKTKPAGTIIAEIQQGYMIYDRILREAMVVVTK